MGNENVRAGITTAIVIEFIIVIIAYFTYDDMLSSLKSTSEIPTLASWVWVWNLMLFIFFAVGFLMQVIGLAMYEFFGGEFE